MMKKLKIGIVDKEQKSLERFQSYLALCENAQCELAVNSVDDLFKCSYPDIDLLFLGIEPEDQKNLKGIEFIKERLPNLQLIACSWSQDAMLIFKALRLGAEGFLLKSISKVELERQFLMINQGGVAFSPSVARIVVEHFSFTKRYFESKTNAPLSKRENQVANLLFQGLTYPEIGATLSLSLNGVRFHIKKIYKKLGINSRTQIHKQVVLA